MNKMSLRRKIKSILIVTAGGIGTFGLINIYKQNEAFYKDVIMPAVHLLDPETAHRLAILASKYRLIPKSSFVDPDSLNIKLFNRHISNPIGIAAGFDKHGEAIEGLNDIGFGFIEVGSVTPKPQEGNEKPRVFRLKEDLAVINRYGFNSDGHDAVFERLSKLKGDQPNSFQGTVGINLGKNKESEEAVMDYIEGIKKFGGVSDYLVINISSPNTPGLRNMQGKKELENLLSSVIKVRDGLEQKPLLFLKLAPDLSMDEKKDIATVIKKRGCKVDGLIISNTTVGRPDSLKSKEKDEIGGLSGLPVKDVSTKMIAEMYKLTGGMTIIGVGGVSSGADAYEKIKAGASAVQIYTSLIYSGPFVVAKIKRELAELLERDGFKNVGEAVGKAAKSYY